MTNWFDENVRFNDDIKSSKKNKIVDEDKGSYVVNLDILSGGVKSDLSMEKTGSDTRQYFEHKESLGSYTKKLKR